MKNTTNVRGLALLGVMTLVTIAAGIDVGQAADTEAFEPQNVVSRRPNVLFLVDSTLTLGAATSEPEYDPEHPYSDDLISNGLENLKCLEEDTAYFDPAGPPNCRKKKPQVGAIPLAKLYCDAASVAELKNTGFLEKKFLERKVDNKGKVTWIALTTNYPNASGDVYCEGSGLANGPTAADFNKLQSKNTLYWSNKLNFDAANKILPPKPGDSRMDKLKDSLEFIAKKYKNQINIGMMRTSTSGAQAGGGSGSGGMVVFPVRAMDAPAMYGTDGVLPYHDGTPDGDATSNTTLDDFIWTMRGRIACKGDANCAPAGPPPIATCGPGEECVQVMTPNGSKKPLAEMLYEAYLYFAGETVKYGQRSFVDPTIKFDSVPESVVDASETGANLKYQKPWSGDCQNNYIIMLTDGISEGDVSEDSTIRTLVESLPETDLSQGGYKYTSKNGSVSIDWNAMTNPWSSNAKGPSPYIDDLAFYLRHANEASKPAMPTTGVKTYAVGFDLSGSTEQEEADAAQMLEDIAKAGGTGSAVFANDASTLTVKIDDIVKNILAGNTAFSAPSVTINAFNRTQNLNDLYMAVFRPEYLRRWKGNLKKYTVDPATGVIMDIRNDPKIPAVDQRTGFFDADSQSLWANTADGELAPEGGAASQLPDWDKRTIKTDQANGTLEDLDTFASGLSLQEQRSIFSLSAPAIPDDKVPSETSTLVNWLYGLDVYDEAPVGPDKEKDGYFDDGNGEKDENKLLLGDPLHSRPAVVVYGRTNKLTGKADVNDAVVYVTTNEGILHAIDTQTGVEKWAFAPQELLYRLQFLRDRSTDVKLRDRNDSRYYGLDGSVKVLRIDRDGDGPIESNKGDRVLLFFGMRRGGSAYYGFDVTNPDSPVMLWRTKLPDDAQSWSNPTIGDWVRVNLSDSSKYGSKNGFNNGLAQNRYVIVIGGGYDPTNDNKGFSRDIKGNKIYMLDVASGEILWWAGPADSDANLELGRMQHSIVADVRVVDLSGDNFADRMYAADLGGQVWRFDIANGQSPDNLVSGGVIASVGGEDTGFDRRFYYAPDVAEVRCGGKAFYNVAIGSGDRENPVNDKTVSNAFFSFRDYLMRTPVDSDNYRPSCGDVTDPCFQMIVDDGSQLVDVTADASPAIDATKAGWKLRLVGPGVPPALPLTAPGEKALAESRTFANGVYFTTYTPQERDSTGDCGTYVGVNRLYVVNACNAAPVNNFHTETGSTPTDDRWQKLAQGSIAPEVVFIFPTPNGNCTTRECMPPPQCLVGLAGCGRGVANNPVRVFWRERGAE